MQKTKKAAVVLSSAVFAVIGGVAISATQAAYAKTVTWAGTVADPNSALYTENVTLAGRDLVGYTDGAPIYIWNTSTANWLGGNYAVGDEVVFRDTFAGGTFVRVGTGNLNPSIMRFVDNGPTPAQYTFLAGGDVQNAGADVSSTTPFGANNTTQLILDTGFTGMVTLRSGAVLTGLTPAPATIIRSGILEVTNNNALPHNGNNQRPTIELAGGEFRNSYNLSGGDATNGPSSTQLQGTLTVSANSTLSAGLAVPTPTTPKLVNLFGPAGGTITDRGLLTVQSGVTLTVRSTNGTRLALPSDIQNSTGTFLLGDSGVSALPTRVQLNNTKAQSASASFDLGTGSSALESRIAGTFSLGALYGGANTSLRGVSGSANVATYSIGARGISTQFDGKITDGIGDDNVSASTGTASLLKVGTATLTLTNASTYTGATTVSGGTLLLSGATASALNTPTITVNTGASLRLDSTTSTPDQLGTATNVVMNRGLFEYVGKLGAANAEAAGTLTISGGANTVRTLASGAVGSASISFASFTRANGAVNFDLASTVNVHIAAAPTLDDGILGGYATVSGSDWATVSGNLVSAYTGYATDTAPGTWTNTQNINLTAGGNSTVTAPTTINSLRLTSGTVSIAAGQSLKVEGSTTAQVGGILLPGTSAATINGGGSLTAGTGAAAAQLIAHVTDASNTLTINTPIADNGATGTVTLVKAGAGKLVLGAVNTLTGGLSIFNGTVAAGAANIFPASANLTVDFGNTFDLNSFNQTFGTVTVIDGSVISTGGAATINAGTYAVQKGLISANLAGAGALTKTTGNSVTLSGSNSYAGGTTINNGTLALANSAALPTGQFVAVNGGDATLDIGTSSPSIGVATLTQGSIVGTSGVLTATSYFAERGTISANLAGAGAAFTKSAQAQTVFLTGTNNSYTGPTTVLVDVLEVSKLADGGLNSSIGASSSAASNLVFGGAQLRYSGTGDNTNRLFDTSLGLATLTNNGTGALNFTNTGALLTSGATLTISGSNTANNLFAPQISGGNPVTKNGGGLWVFTNNGNSYTGWTTLAAGTLVINSIANGGANSPIGASTSDASNLLFSGGTLRYAGTGNTTDRLFSVNTAGGTIESVGSGALQFTNTGAIGLPNPATTATRTLNLAGTNIGNNTIAGAIANDAAGSLTSVSKAGTGKWILNGANTYTGTTTVNAGTLQLGKSAHTPVLSGTTTTGAVIETALVLDYSGGGTNPSSTVQTILAASYASSSNFTSGVIRSTSASGLRALGWINNPATSQVTILNTFDGDANLDGKVNTIDFNQLAGGFGLASQVWENGNFNYDANVDSTDFNLLVGAYGSVLPPAAPTGGASLGSVVPEPASLSLLVLGAAGLIRRRR